MLKQKKKTGFTLIEIMATVLILLLTLGSVLFTFAQATMLNEANKKGATAVNDAQIVLEQIKKEDFANIINFCNTFAAGTFVNLPGEAVDFPTCNFAAGSVNLINVDVRITWIEKPGNPPLSPPRMRNVILSSSFAIGQ